MKPTATNDPPASVTLAPMANDKSFLLRMSAAELEAWRSAAAADGSSLASWIRTVANAAVGRSLVDRAIELHGMLDGAPVDREKSRLVGYDGKVYVSLQGVKARGVLAVYLVDGTGKLERLKIPPKGLR